MLSNNMKQEMDIATIADLYTYLDDYAPNVTGRNLKEIMSNMASKNPKVTKTSEYKTITAAIEKNKNLGELELINQSSNDTKDIWTDDPIQAVCFKYKNEQGNNDYYVAYRGTGNGRWGDNGVGQTEASSDMQEKAAEYFDELVENHPEIQNVHKNGGRLIVTGHSKGGNEAQYVTMMSKYEHLIDNCYSYDGQGFSKKADDKFRQQYGEEYYNKQKDKIYSVCGENDPVHEFGKKQLASEDHTYYVGYTGEGAGWHDLNAMLLVAGGTYTGLRWSEANDGHGEQGDIGKLAKQLNEKVQELDEKDRESVYKAMMQIAEMAMQKKLNPNDLSNVDVTWRDWLKFGAKGIPTIIKTLVETPEGRKLLLKYGLKGAEWAIEKYGPIGGIALIVLVSIYAIRFAANITVLVIACKIVDHVIEVYETIKDVGKKIIDCAKKMRDTIVNTYKDIRKKLHNTFNKCAKYSRSHDYIYIDTVDLENYALRLDGLNSRLISIESQIHALYAKLSPSNKLHLQAADSEIGNSGTLTRSRDYLYKTAALFNEAEKKIAAGIK